MVTNVHSVSEYKLPTKIPLGAVVIVEIAAENTFVNHSEG